MNRRPPLNRGDMTDKEKNSFSVPRVSPRQENPIQAAIDDSLSGVRFNAQDMRSVLRATRRSETRRTPAKKPRSRLRPDLIFAFSLVLMVAVPLALFAARTVDVRTPMIAAGPGEADRRQTTTPVPGEDLVSEQTAAAPELTYGVGESEAIRIARECFNAQCDTTIFSFEEYEVGVELIDSTNAQYVVTMDSIYHNGCRFTVILSADTGDILQYSTPRLATVPSYLNSESAEVRAWYEKYGAYLFTWPQDAQAEFSRRYEGGTLREAKEDEISYVTAQEVIAAEAGESFSAFYPVLYSERASSSGRAYYVVYCYVQEVTDTLPEGEPMIVTFDAQTGEILSIQGHPLGEDMNGEVTELPPEEQNAL